jgi:hypothetical protein
MGRAAAPDPTPFAYAQSPRRHVVRSIIISDSIVQQPANMTEGVANSNDADAAAQRASEQARLRKERREAKLKAGGSARLNKITGIGGRPQIGKREANCLGIGRRATILMISARMQI